MRYIKFTVILLIGVSLLTCWFSYLLIRAEYRDWLLSNRGIITDGSALEAKATGRSTHVIYVFKHLDRNYIGSTPVTWSWAKKTQFPTTVRVRYLKDRPEISDAFEIRNRRVQILNYILLPIALLAGLCTFLGAFVIQIEHIAERLARTKGANNVQTKSPDPKCAKYEKLQQ